MKNIGYGIKHRGKRDIRVAVIAAMFLQLLNEISAPDIKRALNTLASARCTLRASPVTWQLRVIIITKRW